MITDERAPEARTGKRFSPGALAVFFALAYLLSWSWVVPLAAAHQVVPHGSAWPTHYPALFGPAIAAIIVTAWTAGRLGVRDLLLRMIRWRVGLRWWLVALSPVLFLGVGLIAVLLAGKPLPREADFGSFSGLPSAGLVTVAFLIILGALGEEAGWRGFALPQLQRRFSPLASTLLLSVLWFAWHLPQFLVIATYRDFAPVQYVGMLLGLTCGAVVLTWLYNGSGGSILLVALWHGLYNVVSATQAATGLLAAVVTTLIMIQGVSLISREIRAQRRGRPSVLR